MLRRRKLRRSRRSQKKRCSERRCLANPGCIGRAKACKCWIGWLWRTSIRSIKFTARSADPSSEPSTSHSCSRTQVIETWQLIHICWHARWSSSETLSSSTGHFSPVALTKPSTFCCSAWRQTNATLLPTISNLQSPCTLSTRASILARQSTHNCLCRSRPFPRVACVDSSSRLEGT